MPAIIVHHAIEMAKNNASRFTIAPIPNIVEAYDSMLTWALQELENE